MRDHPHRSSLRSDALLGVGLALGVVLIFVLIVTALWLALIP